MSARRGNPNAAAPGPLRVVLDLIDMLGRLDGWLGAACLAALTGLMMGEVAVRALSDIFPWMPADIPVAWEYSSYLMAAAFTFGIGAGSSRMPRPAATGSASSCATFSRLDTIRSRTAGVCTRDSSKRKALMMCCCSMSVWLFQNNVACV